MGGMGGTGAYGQPQAQAQGQQGQGKINFQDIFFFIHFIKTSLIAFSQ